MSSTIGFRVRLRWIVLEAGEPTAKLGRLVDRHNAKEHSATLDDALNPERVEMAKVVAFLAALGRLPAEKRSALAKGTILLADHRYLLGTVAPTTPESFATLTDIANVKVEGDVVGFVPVMGVDREQARATIAKARAALAALEQAPSDASGDRARDRFRLAQTWSAAARAVALHDTDPARRAANEAEAAEASSAASRYAVPTGGMPGDDELLPL